MKLSRRNCWLKGKKWFHHVGTFHIVQKREGNKDLRLVISNSLLIDGREREWITITDSTAKDVFIWLGRYLAKKGKLPRAHALEEIAVGAQRTAKAIREVNAKEIYENLVGDNSGLEIEAPATEEEK